MCPGTPFYETSVYHTWKRECQVLVTDDDDQEIIGNIDPFFREMHALGNLDKKNHWAHKQGHNQINSLEQELLIYSVCVIILYRNKV